MCVFVRAHTGVAAAAHIRKYNLHMLFNLPGKRCVQCPSNLICVHVGCLCARVRRASAKSICRDNLRVLARSLCPCLRVSHACLFCSWPCMSYTSAFGSARGGGRLAQRDDHVYIERSARRYADRLQGLSRHSRTCRVCVCVCVCACVRVHRMFVCSVRRRAYECIVEM